MKSWIVAFGCFLITHAGMCQPFETVDELAESFVRSLRRMETSSFVRLYAQDPIITSNMNQSLGFRFQDSLVGDFTTIIETGIELGIDWSNIRFIKAEYITQSTGPFLIAHPTVIVFQHRLFRYAIDMNCTKIRGSWGFVPINRVHKPIYMKKI